MTKQLYGSMSPELVKKKIAYTDPGYLCNKLYVLYSANNDGSNQIALASEQASAEAPAWSPDGKRMVVVKGGNAIYTLNADGTDPVEVISINEKPGILLLPVWSKDGTQIAFSKSSNSSNPLTTYVINTDGTEMFAIPYSGGFPDHVLSWSPDSSQIAYTEKPEQGDYEIHLMRRDGSDRSKLADGYQPDWSPDGKQIVFVTNEWVGNQLFSTLNGIAPDGSGLNTLFAGEPNRIIYSPIWSPKGTYIAFRLGHYSIDINAGDFELYIVEANGTNPRNMTVREASTQLYIGDGTPSWSFDEQFIAYSSYRSERTDGQAGTREVRISEVSNGYSTTLIKNAISPAWQP